MQGQLSRLAFCSPRARKLGLGALAVWLILASFAAPLRAQGGFFAQVKLDGQNAGLYEAADYGLDQQRQAGKFSDHDYELAHQAEQRIVSAFASRHSGNPLFLYYEYSTKQQATDNKMQYGAALLIAGMRIQQEETHPGMISGQTASSSGQQLGVKSSDKEQPSNLPNYLLIAIVLLAAAVAGYMILVRRGAKPVPVSYVNVKSPPADPPVSGESSSK